MNRTPRGHDTPTHLEARAEAELRLEVGARHAPKDVAVVHAAL